MYTCIYKQVNVRSVIPDRLQNSEQTMLSPYPNHPEAYRNHTQTTPKRYPKDNTLVFMVCIVYL